jgi:peptide/nickel transport system permease protein
MTTTPLTPTTLDDVPARALRRTKGRQQFVRRHWVALLGGAIFFAAVLLALLAPVISPYDPAAQDVPSRLQGPSLAHPLGTDDFGRDTLTRVLWGARPILFAGIVSVLLSLLIGALLGLLAGYFGGWIDDVIMRVIDVILSFPLMLLAILIVATLGPGLFNAIVAIACAQVPLFARLTRSLVLSIARNEYVDAARALGTSCPTCLARCWCRPPPH